MNLAAATQAPGARTSARVLFRAIDMPARAAVELGRASPLRLVGIAGSGAAMVMMSSLSTSVLTGSPITEQATLGGLAAAATAIGVVVPALVVIASYARVAATARTIVAAASIGVLLAGVVCVAAVPLLAFLALVAPADAMLATPALLISGAAVVAASSVPARVIAALDERTRAQLMSRAFVVAAYVAFVAQLVGRWS